MKGKCLSILAALVLTGFGAQAAPPLNAELFPACYQHGRYNLVGDFPGVLVFTFTGGREAVKEAWLSMDLPQGVELIGASPYRPTRKVEDAFGAVTYDWEAEPVAACGKVKGDGGQHCFRHVIGLNPTLLASLAPDKPVWGCEERVYLKASPALAGKTLKARWRLMTRDWEGPEQTIELTVLPPLTPPGRKAKSFHLMASLLGQATAPFPDVRDAYHRYWLSLAERPYSFAPTTPHSYTPSWKRNLSSDGRAKDFRWCAMIDGAENLSLWKNRGLWPTLPKLVYADDTPASKKRNCRLCPSFLSDSSNSRFWEVDAPQALRDNTIADCPAKPEAFVLDFEPMYPAECCFCDTCRKNFATEAKLAAVPDAKEIKAKHAKAWLDFRIRQNGKINANIARMVRKAVPGAKYWVCTDPLHAGTQTLSDWCGCDERLFDPAVDAHLPMPYYSGLRFYKDVELNVKTLKKPVFPLIDPSERIASFYSQYTPLKVKQDILACAALGAEGIGFWPEDYLDGAYLSSVAQGMGLVAKLEDYYAAKRDDSLAEVAPAPVLETTVVDSGRELKLSMPPRGENIQRTVHAKGADRLLTVFNFDESADATLRVKLPGLPPGDYRARDVEIDQLYLDDAGKPLDAAALSRGFLAKVKAGDVLLVEVSRNATGVPQAEFRKELAAAKSRLGDTAAFAGARQNGAAAGWGDVDGDGNLEVKLSLPGGWAYVDYGNTGDVVGWFDKNSGGDVLAGGMNRGFLGGLLVHEAKGAVLTPWKLKALDIRDGCPVTVLAARFVADASAGANADAKAPLAGLEVEKTVKLADNGSLLETVLRLTNDSGLSAPMKLSFRVRNYVGAKAPSEIRLKTAAGGKELTGDALLLAPGVTTHPFAKLVEGLKAGPWSPAAVAIEATGGKPSWRMTIAPDTLRTVGLYSWRGNGELTVEWLSPEISLAPGGNVSFTQTCLRAK